MRLICSWLLWQLLGRFYLPRWLWSRYYRSAIWRYRRRKAIGRAGGRCAQCGDGGRLEVHHKTYIRFGRESASDLEVLCRTDHLMKHGEIT